MSSSFIMRPARPDDIGPLCSLMSELGGSAISAGQMQDRLEFVAGSDFDSLFVCENSRKIVGLLGFRIRENLEEESHEFYKRLGYQITGYRFIKLFE